MKWTHALCKHVSRAIEKQGHLHFGRLSVAVMVPPHALAAPMLAKHLLARKTASTTTQCSAIVRTRSEGDQEHGCPRGTAMPGFWGSCLWTG